MSEPLPAPTPPSEEALSREDEALLQQLRVALALDVEAALRGKLQAHLAGRFELLETLGSGAMGIVFKARDLQLARPVAIKCLLPGDPQGTPSRVLQEARQVARINHPHVASVYAVSDDPALPFIVMECVQGVPLTEALADRPLNMQLEAFIQLLRAVAELHRRGLVHLDLKPSNVLIDPHGTVKVVDFGIAHSDLAIPSAIGSPIRGTPAYAAPEQSLGVAPAPTADVFSLGVLLFELLTGQRPFEGATAQELQAAIRDRNPPLPRSLRALIPGALQAICLVALEKDPARRYPTARQFHLDLERFLHGEAVTANPTVLASILDHGIERHAIDIERWQADRMISARESDDLLNKYNRLRQREEFWVLDSRRISFSQVMLHLGAWSCVVAALLMLIFPWSHVHAFRPLLANGLTVLLLASGLVLWHFRTRRVALVLLMGATLSAPLAVGTLLDYHKRLVDAPGQQLLPVLSNFQLLASMLTALAVATALWIHTRTTAFALLFAISGFGVTTAVCSLFDLATMLNPANLDTVAGWYLCLSIPLLGFALYWDLLRKNRPFAAPLYLFSVSLLLCSLTLIATHGPTLPWLGLAEPPYGDDFDRHVKFGFMINGLLYLLCGFIADQSRDSPSLRRIATLLFWLGPSHLLIPIYNLQGDWPLSAAWSLPELLLPALALAFVFASVPKQMKSFFFSGLAYLALSVHQLTQAHFQDVFAWPLSLAVLGILLILAAWRYPALFDRPRPATEPAVQVRHPPLRPI